MTGPKQPPRRREKSKHEIWGFGKPKKNPSGKKNPAGSKLARKAAEHKLISPRPIFSGR